MKKTHGHINNTYIDRSLCVYSHLKTALSEIVVILSKETPHRNLTKHGKYSKETFEPNLVTNIHERL